MSDTSERKQTSYRLTARTTRLLADAGTAHDMPTTDAIATLADATVTYFGLPPAAVDHLERDRTKLRMTFFQYLQHAMYRRSEAVIENGPGFDSPTREDRRKTK